MRRTTALFLFSILAACGGGGGGMSGGHSRPDGGDMPPQLPRIEAVALVYPALNFPPNNEGNMLVVVRVVDATTGSPRREATVTANGVPLQFVPDTGVFRGWLLGSTGDDLSVTVQSGSSTWQATGPLPPTHPAIVSPWPGDNFKAPGHLTAQWNQDLYVAWEGVLPDSEYHYAVALADERSELVWPGVAQLASVGSSQGRSFMIPAGSLTGLRYYVAAGIAKSQAIAGAASGSTLSIGAFSMAMVAKSLNDNVTLKRLELRTGHRNGPLALASGSQRQLMADGIYEDSNGTPSKRDLTTQVTWSSDQEDVVSVSSRGIMTGGRPGIATITVSRAGVTESALVRVLGMGAASPIADAHAYQNNAAHTGYATFGGVTFTSAAAWSAAFPGLISYPIVTQDSIFVLAANRAQPSISLYAHDALTGARKWGPVEVDRPQQWASLGYEGGRILTLNNDCVLRAHSASDGTLLWTTNLAALDSDNVWSCRSEPTTLRGIAYVTVAGVAGTVMAIDIASGALLWKAYLQHGGGSLRAPTVDDDGVYLTYVHHTYRLNPRSGEIQWHYSGPGFGGQETWSALRGGRLYAQDFYNGLILDSQTGKRVGTFRAGPVPPAIDDNYMYVVEGGEMRALDLQDGSTAWLASAPERFASAPTVVDDAVFYLSQNSTSLQALQASTGSLLWAAQLGSPVDPIGVSAPVHGMAAGHGILAVPAGDTLFVYRLHD